MSTPRGKKQESPPKAPSQQDLQYDIEKFGEVFENSTLRPGTIQCAADITSVVVFVATVRPLTKEENAENIARYGIWFGQDSPLNNNGFEIGREKKSHVDW